MSQTDMEVARLNVLSGAVQAASSEHGPVDRAGARGRSSERPLTIA